MHVNVNRAQASKMHNYQSKSLYPMSKMHELYLGTP